MDRKTRYQISNHRSISHNQGVQHACESFTCTDQKLGYLNKWVKNRNLFACKHQPLQPIYPTATHLDHLLSTANEDIK